MRVWAQVALGATMVSTLGLGAPAVAGEPTPEEFERRVGFKVVLKPGPAAP